MNEEASFHMFFENNDHKLPKKHFRVFMEAQVKFLKLRNTTANFLSGN